MQMPNSLKTATVIVPSIGRPCLRRCVASVLGQTRAAVNAYVVCDGPAFRSEVQAALDGLDTARIQLLNLPENVGAGGYYGHRIFAGCSHFVNSEFVLFLDEDNWYEPEHIESLIARITAHGLDWAFSLRRICSAIGEFIADDDCESLGPWPSWQNHHLVDTSSYCVKTAVAAAVASAWHGSGAQDRTYFATLSKYFPRFASSGRYTLNYCLGGNPGSVTAEFFLHGNEVMRQRHTGGLPWKATPLHTP